MNQKIKPRDYNTICRLHREGFKPVEIAPRYGVIDDTIRNILQVRGAFKPSNSRQYFYNFDYFDCIDSREKAYFLGLIYADGNNSENGLTLSLSEPDQYLLRALADSIGYKGPLKTPSKIKSSHKQKHVLCIHGKRIRIQLDNLGCPEKKSLVLRFPTEKQVSNRFMPHFLRGYLDGDGSIHYTTGTEKKLHVTFTSSPFFCRGLNEFLFDRFGFRGRSTTYTHSKAEDIKLSTRMAIVLLDYLYDSASVKMERKFNKFIQFLKIYTPHNVGGTDISTNRVLSLRNKWLNHKLT